MGLYSKAIITHCKTKKRYMFKIQTMYKPRYINSKIYAQLEMGFKQNTLLSCYRERKVQTLSKDPEKVKGKPTFKPLPIMRLTALLPPPPTPTTLILADSMGANEQLTTPKHRRFSALLLLLLRGMHVLKEGTALWW